MLVGKKFVGITAALGSVFSVLAIGGIALYTAGQDADPVVIGWWIGLTVISIMNLCLWGIAVQEYRLQAQRDPRRSALRKYYPGLTFIYVVVCAYRSFFPRGYVSRVVMVDSWWSNIFLARLGATFAEISFILLLAFYLHETADGLRSKVGIRIAKLIIPPIIVAQGFVWANIITTIQLCAVVEESLWGIMGVCLLIALMDFYPKVEIRRRPLLVLLMFFVIAFIAFLVFIDLPKYYLAYVADQAAGKVYLSFSEGIRDLLTRWVVTYDLAAWREEMVWLGLYFSTAVWLVIYLINAPLIQTRGRPSE